VAVTFDPDDYELRWPPRLFVDEANRLLTFKADSFNGSLRRTITFISDVRWLLTEAFVSTVPRDTLDLVRDTQKWLTELIREAPRWPEPGTRKPFWSARVGRRASPDGMTLTS
jgi:hypothetical protein